MIVEEILFPAYKIGTGSWTDDDPESILRTTSGTPSCESTGLYYQEDEGDDADIGFRLEPPDNYAFGFQNFEVRFFHCGGFPHQSTFIRFNIGSETFGWAFSNSTGNAQWYSFEFESEVAYPSSVLQFAELWISADSSNHSDTKIPTIYVVAIGEYDVDQWNPDGAVELGVCAGARHHKAFGGLQIEGEAWNSNALIRFPSGGVRVGELQPRYATGGLQIEGEAANDNAIRGDGGTVAGGTATVSFIANPRTSGGVICTGVLFPNGFAYRLPIVIPAASEALLGVIIGFPLYLPFDWERYRMEDDTGAALAFEVVSQQGLKLSVFVKVNVRTTDQTIYFYSDGRAV